MLFKMDKKVKRSRAINWDDEEKVNREITILWQLFLRIIRQYVHIIENKSLDTQSNRNKLKAWQEVHRKFNELNSRPRTEGQLRVHWKTLKVNACKKRRAIQNASNTTAEKPAIIIKKKEPKNFKEAEEHKEDDCTKEVTSVPSSNSVNNVDPLRIDQGQQRRMEMAEEEHAIKMSIQREKLKCIILEREILEIRKAREEFV